MVEVMHNGGIKQEVPLVQTGGQWRFADQQLGGRRLCPDGEGRRWGPEM